MEERSTINTFQAFVPTFETDDSSLWQKPGLHMVSEAVISGQQGGNILHGAMMGALAAGQGQVLGRYGGRMRTGARLAVVAENRPFKKRFAKATIYNEICIKTD